jgi:hypothetical protein
MEWDYTEDFSEAVVGDTLHSRNGEDLIIDKIVLVNNIHYPMVAGVIFNDINYYENPKYAYRLKKC